jgi:SAM-dependent methyltransferase
VQGDASDFSTSEKFDAVVSLFHVASYQTSNEALLGFFRSASSALNPGGLFVFDYWYGPAVLSDRPHARERQETADDGTSVVRKTEPVMHFEENVVDVNYAFNIRRGGVEHLFHETHRMRYLFVPELRMYGGLAGFILEEAATWMDRKPLTDASWYGYAVMRKVGV